MKTRIGVLLIIGVVVFGLFILLKPKKSLQTDLPTSPENLILTLVKNDNQVSISDQDITFFKAQKDCYVAESSQITSDEVAIINFIEQILYSFTAADLNLLNDIDMAGESKRIDEETQSPDILKCIKNVYRDYNRGYIDFFVAPGIINRVVHKHFSVDAEIQKKSREKIEEIKQQILSQPDDFISIGKSFDAYQRITYPPTPSVQSNPNDPLVKNVLTQLKPNEIFPNIIEDDFSYRIVKLVKIETIKNVATYTFDSITILKIPFDPWFKDLNKDVRIYVYDKKLYEQIKQKYPEIWWVDQLTREISVDLFDLEQATLH